MKGTTIVNITARRRAASLVAVASLVLGMLPTPAIAPANAAGQAGSSEFTITVADLQFILKQIKIAEAHASRYTPTTASTGTLTPATSVLGLGVNDVPDPSFPWGLRTVDGSKNNLSRGRSGAGAADGYFPRMAPPVWRNGRVLDESFRMAQTLTSYGTTAGSLADPEPRVISNLIADQSVNNPAAYNASDHIPDLSSGGAGSPSLVIPNTPPAGALIPAIPAYNSMFTFFGQFFDHGLDLVTKRSEDIVMLPLPADDELTAATSPHIRFMFLNRTDWADGSPTTTVGKNKTTPWVDQNQTYASVASKQVFLREYARGTESGTLCTEQSTGTLIATGRLLTGPGGQIGTWADVKNQARKCFGIALDDTDVGNVPMLLTDEYGRFMRGPAGYPLLVTSLSPSLSVVQGNPAAPVSPTVVNALRTGHAFLDDIAHYAAPKGAPDVDDIAGDKPTCAEGVTTCYDNELLDRHYVTGDGRGNENIGLTAIHTIFHAEHNRIREDIKRLIAENPVVLAGFTDGTGYNPLTQWGFGERLFQASRFVNEMEYQHLVFDTFARRISPSIRPFVRYNATIDPSVTGEFASAVYRFGHSMLNESVRRLSPTNQDQSEPLFDAFLNPVAFMDGYTDARDAAASIARGSVKQVGNEIDEFVTGALRNNVVGLPLDLASMNIARGRDTGLPPLNEFRKALYTKVKSRTLAPYTSWIDFGSGLRHPDSLVNFVAAYGTHPSIVDASTATAKREAAARLVSGTDAPADAGAFMSSTGAWSPPTPVNGITDNSTGIDAIDLWIGGLAETRGAAGGLLGSTFDFVFSTQLESLQDGDRFYYLSRLAGTNLLNEVANNTLADMFVRNSDLAESIADFFSAPQNVVDLRNPPPAGPAIAVGSLNTIYIGRNEEDDTITAGYGNDTLRGYGRNDYLDGGGGSDNVQGGAGNDVVVDRGLTGADIVLGGTGDDYIDSGPGPDVVDAGPGNDFYRADKDPALVSLGWGNDLAIGGFGVNTINGDAGDDWIDGAEEGDFLTGDQVPPPLGFDLIPPGNDVIAGGLGSDTIAGGGRDDIILGGDSDPASWTPDTIIGDTGFDWVTYMNAAVGPSKPGVTADLGLLARNPGNPQHVAMDAFASGDVEGLSGGPGNDVLYGDSRLTNLNPFGDGDEFTLASRTLVDRNGVIANRLRRWTNATFGFDVNVANGVDGNILLGGPGSDTIWGRGGNDLIDGDAALVARLEVSCGGVAYRATTLDELNGLIEAGTIGTGGVSTCTASNVKIVREVIPGTPGSDVDTVAYSGNYADYVIRRTAASTRLNPGSTTPTAGDYYWLVEGAEGMDVLWNIEQLVFLDRSVNNPVRLVNTDGSPVTGNLPGSVLPGAPTLVTVLPNGGGSLRVSWSLPVTPGGGYISRFDVTATDQITRIVKTQCSTSPTNTGTAAGNGLTPLTRFCTLTGLTDGTDYRIEVSARNSPFGSGALSPVVIGVSGGNRPSVPATPSLLRAVAVNQSVTASFNATTDPTRVSSYTVQAWTEPTGGVLPLFTCTYGVGISTAGSCTIVGPLSPYGLPPYERHYWFDIYATNVAGNSPTSPRILVVTPPSAPGTVSATPGNRRIAAAWSVPEVTGGGAITGYVARLYDDSTGTQVGSSGTTPLSAATTSYTFTSLTGGAPLVNGKRYRVTVTAANTYGTSPQSDPVTVTPDATVADPPIIGTVTPSNQTALVRWTAAPNDGGSTVDSFRASVYDSSTATSGAIASCDTTGTAPGVGASCLVQGLTNGLTYWARVVAHNGKGDSAPSAASAPFIPAFVPAAPVMNEPTVPAAGQATFSWTRPDSGGSPILAYTLRLYSASTGGTASQTVTRTGADNTSYTFTGLTTTTRYWADVTAGNGVGSSPPSSPRVSVVPQTVPGAPVVSAAARGDRQTVVTWSAPATGGATVTRYRATAFTAASGDASAGSCDWTSGNGTTLTCTITGAADGTRLSNGTTYYVAVAAQNAVGWGSYSASRVQVTPDVQPPAPTSVSAVRNGTRTTIIVSWSDSTTATFSTPIVSYTVRAWSRLSGGSISYSSAPLTIAPGTFAPGTPRTASIVGVRSGTTYYVDVVGTNQGGIVSVPGPSPRLTVL